MIISKQSSIVSHQVKKVLVTSNPLNKQLEQFCRLINQVTGVDEEKLKISVELLVSRIEAALSYKSTLTLKGNIVLIRTKSDVYQLSESYGLGKVRKQFQEICKNQLGFR